MSRDASCVTTVERYASTWSPRPVVFAGQRDGSADVCRRSDDVGMASQWHPIFLTSEPSPGVWLMKAAHEVEAFGRIELRRVSGGVRYKVTHGGEVIGWAGTLQLACERLFLEERRRRAEVYSGPPNGRLTNVPNPVT